MAVSRGNNRVATGNAKGNRSSQKPEHAAAPDPQGQRLCFSQPEGGISMATDTTQGPEGTLASTKGWDQTQGLVKGAEVQEFAVFHRPVTLQRFKSVCVCLRVRACAVRPCCPQPEGMSPALRASTHTCIRNSFAKCVRSLLCCSVIPE
ncbi:hypothetical protein KIL84_002845 [Mauremys mutica]|uniref:Uncharacterized protein n=1 Tax=Mauremys mutica TaxID=74926 RepID=A0A9D3WSN5_9SAUR|nr:hypothetical protein KIL84_002845 [Mauremys mutica]